MKHLNLLSKPVYKLIKNRRSIRKYKRKAPMINKKDMQKILDAGRMAPSAKNRQNWHFTVLQGPWKDRIANKMLDYANIAEKEEPEIQGYKSSVRDTAKVILEAPILVLIFKRKNDNFATSDNLSIGACVENMLLQAEDLGIGSLWIRDIYCVNDWVIQEYGKYHHLDVDNSMFFELSCAVVFGYADEKPSMRFRRKLEDTTDWFFSYMS